ncbi:L-threonylcarbamoyladenylate synthase [Anaerosinus sp.]
MKTKLISSGDEEGLKLAASLLKSGKLVAFPTETVYGLGANGFDSEAVAHVYCAKGRALSNPLSLLLADVSQIEKVVTDVSDKAKKLIKAFSPGPITFVLKRKNIVPNIVTNGKDTVGVRIPDHEIARKIIRLADIPIAAPSANTSGRPSPTSAVAVFDDLQGKISAVVDGGDCAVGIDSTIIDCTQEVLTVLRPGVITLEMLRQVVGAGSVQMKEDIIEQNHYAPSAPMFILEGAPNKIEDEMKNYIRKAVDEKKRLGIIASDELIAGISNDVLTYSYGNRGDMKAIAGNLYRALRFFDDHKVDVIYAEGIDKMGIGLAIMNRMYKASGYRIITL